MSLLFEKTRRDKLSLLIDFCFNFIYLLIIFKYLTEISNGFMTAKTIRRRLLSVLDLNVHVSTVGRARKTILGIKYNS
jgi:hypothetical protein